MYHLLLCSLCIYYFLGSNVWSAVVRPWWSWRLGHLASWGWLHVWARHLRELQPHKWFDTDQQGSPAGDGGELVGVKVLWIILDALTHNCSAEKHALCIHTYIHVCACLWLSCIVKWAYNYNTNMVIAYLYDFQPCYCRLGMMLWQLRKAALFLLYVAVWYS